MGFDPARFQTRPPACYRASWQLPAPGRYPGQPAARPVQRPGRVRQHPHPLADPDRLRLQLPEALIGLAMLSVGGLRPPLPSRAQPTHRWSTRALNHSCGATTPAPPAEMIARPGQRPGQPVAARPPEPATRQHPGRVSHSAPPPSLGSASQAGKGLMVNMGSTMRQVQVQERVPRKEAGGRGSRPSHLASGSLGTGTFYHLCVSSARPQCLKLS
jgi:hypothetical protein